MKISRKTSITVYFMHLELNDIKCIAKLVTDLHLECEWTDDCQDAFVHFHSIEIHDMFMGLISKH